jgi:hypothetical protein
MKLRLTSFARLKMRNWALLAKAFRTLANFTLDQLPAIEFGSGVNDVVHADGEKALVIYARTARRRIPPTSSLSKTLSPRS